MQKADNFLAGQSCFPLEFDFSFYRSRYPSLSKMSDAGLIQHYEAHGRLEGRQASSAALRSGFIPLFERMRPILEIGPFDCPMVTGKDVSYFDVKDQSALIERAKTIGRAGVVPYIEFVSPNGDLSIVDRKFRAVCSAHVIEHQPDLVSHLEQVSRILESEGLYFLAVPDKRFCFDRFIPESNVAEIVEAYEEKRKIHTLKNVISHFALSTHNDALLHWNGDHQKAEYERSIPMNVTNAIRNYRAANGSYIDVHAWRFSPSSFRNVIRILFDLRICSFKVIRVYDTPHSRLEFMAILQRVS